jgi:hypothetical protein
MSAQLELPALPIAHPVPCPDLVEPWLCSVYEAAAAYERRWFRWWSGNQIAVAMKQPIARVGPALRCLARRRALDREQLGVGPHGEPVYVYAVRDLLSYEGPDQ